jgi:hypothetical protein
MDLAADTGEAKAQSVIRAVQSDLTALLQELEKLERDFAAEDASSPAARPTS